jgi:hypothetical protein
MPDKTASSGRYIEIVPVPGDPGHRGSADPRVEARAKATLQRGQPCRDRHFRVVKAVVPPGHRERGLSATVI